MNTDSTTLTKVCKRCGVEKPATVEYFNRTKGGALGLKSRCKECTREEHKAWRAANLEYDIERQRKNRELERANRVPVPKPPKPTHKACTICGELFPATREFFYPHPRGVCGLAPHCKSCGKEKSRKYREANREKVFESNRKSYQKYRDKKVQYSRIYYREHRDDYAVKMRQWYVNNREKVNAGQKRRRALNPDKFTLRIVRYRARKRNLPDTLTQQQWDDCLEYFGYCCAACGCQLRDLFGNVEPHRDHWIPLTNPNCLGTTVDNIVCLCNSCNSSKNNSLPAEWLEKKFGKKQGQKTLKRIEAYFEWAKGDV